MKKPLLEDLQAHWESHLHFITHKIQTFGDWIPRLLTRWYCNGHECGLDQIALVDGSGRRFGIGFYHHSLTSITLGRVQGGGTGDWSPPPPILR